MCMLRCVELQVPKNVKPWQKTPSALPMTHPPHVSEGHLFFSVPSADCVWSEKMNQLDKSSENE